MAKDKAKTQPKPLKPEGIKLESKDLAAGRYGTYEMVQIWGPEKTFEYSLKAQAQSALTLSKLYPHIVPPAHAEEIASKANLEHIDPDRIRELEENTGHDVIAINTALEEVVSREAGAHINKAKTSADTTQPARALQLKQSLDVIADTIENLRDIIIEKSIEWIDKPHMDPSHGYDALPTVAGRPLAHYAEMLQTDLQVLKFFYNFSIRGKWADATGNHHSASALGMSGMKLQNQYCKDLKITHMIAPAQVPGLEFEADISYILARTGETLNNLAKYIAWGRSDDVNIFINTNPKKKKGSSAMPHKDVKNGNPVIEEQNMSARNYGIGNLVTALINCDMPYARNLAASSNSRINFEDGFKFLDHAARRLSGIAYWIGLREDRAKERVLRSYGVVTSQQVMTYLTDYRAVKNPMTRSEAHDLMGELAADAWGNKKQFIDVLLQNKAVTSRLDESILREIADPLKYIGESKRIIKSIKSMYYHKKTF